MTRLTQLFTLAAVLMFGGASTCQKPVVTNPVVAGVINCAEAGVHKAALNIIDDVASALATGDYMAGLEDLVKKFTEGAVDCAVSEVGKTSTGHAQMNQLEADKAKRAKAWLDSRKVEFSSSCRWPKAYIAGICPWGCAKESVSGAVVVPASAPTHAVDGRKAREASGRTTLIVAGICPWGCAPTAG